MSGFSLSSEPFTLERDCVAVMVPQGESVTLPAGQIGYITQALGGSFTVYVEGNLFRIAGHDADALGKNPNLDGIAPYVVDSGEGRWTVDAAMELSVSAPVITLSLMERYRSRDSDSFADKLLASLRNEFGGHAIKKE